MHDKIRPALGAGVFAVLGAAAWWATAQTAADPSPPAAATHSTSDVSRRRKSSVRSTTRTTSCPAPSIGRVRSASALPPPAPGFQNRQIRICG
jgi:hypothetical protein